MEKKGGDEARLSDLQDIERRQRKCKAAISVSGCSESWCTVAWEKAAFWLSDVPLGVCVQDGLVSACSDISRILLDGCCDRVIIGRYPNGAVLAW